jgi:hypothetical protein
MHISSAKRRMSKKLALGEEEVKRGRSLMNMRKRRGRGRHPAAHRVVQ